MIFSELDMTERTFQILEHTADKGVAAEGKTMAEAFENTAYGMFSLFVDLEKLEAKDRIEMTVTADDREQLLWTWLSDLMYAFEVDKVLPVDFHVVEISDTSLKAELPVRRSGDDVEWLGAAVKAVTYHQLKVEHTGDLWKTQVYVDV